MSRYGTLEFANIKSVRFYASRLVRIQNRELHSYAMKAYNFMCLYNTDKNHNRYRLACEVMTKLDRKIKEGLR